MNDFLNWEQTNKMHSLGYDGKTLMYIDDEEDIINDDSAELIGAKPAILTSAAFRWFREKYEIMSWISRHRFNITTSLGNKVYYRWVIEYETVTSEPHINSQIIYSSEEYDNYPEAELACLDKLIEIVESKQKEDGRNSIKDR